MQTRMQFLLYENKYFLVYIRGSLVVSIPLPSLDAKTYMTAIFLARAPAYAIAKTSGFEINIRWSMDRSPCHVFGDFMSISLMIKIR